MISFDTGYGGSDVDLTPVYNSIAQLSSNKLDKTDYTGGGFPYLVDYSAGTILNSDYVYNITGDIESLTDMCKVMKGYDVNMYYNTFTDNSQIYLYGIKTMTSNTIENCNSLILNGEFNSVTRNLYTSIGTAYISGYSYNYNTFSSVFNMNFTCNIGGDNFYNVTFLTYSARDAGYNRFRTVGEAKIEGEFLYNGTYSSITQLNFNCGNFKTNTLDSITYLSGNFKSFNSNSISSMWDGAFLNGRIFRENTIAKAKIVNYDCLIMSDTLNTVSYVSINGRDIGPSISSCIACRINGFNVSSGTISNCNGLTINGQLLSANVFSSGSIIDIRCGEMGSNAFDDYYKCDINAGVIATEFFNGIRRANVQADYLATCIFQNCYTVGITGSYEYLSFSNVNSVNLDKWCGTIGWSSVDIFNFNTPDGLIISYSDASTSRFIDSVTQNIPSSMIRIGGFPLTYVFH